MQDWHFQDWLIVYHALVDWAGTEPETPRQRQALTLVREIEAEFDLTPAEAVLQIDSEWGPDDWRHAR